jgi:HSP20 family protein
LQHNTRKEIEKMNTTKNEIATADRRSENGNLRAVEYLCPAVDLHREAEAYRLDVEMPGVPKNGVDLTLEDGKLIIVGHRLPAENHGRSLHRERDSRNYRRVFDLDPTIDAGKIEASIEQGLLRVHLRKAELHQPRKITVG